MLETLIRQSSMHLSSASPIGGGGGGGIWGLYGDFVQTLSPSGGGNVGTLLLVQLTNNYS